MTPVPVIAPIVHSTGVERWRPLVAEYFPSGQIDNALAIMTPESHGDPNALNYNTNGSTDRGLFQVNSIHIARVNGNLAALFDPATNVQVAAAIYREQGWCPWATAAKLGLCR